MSDRAGELIGRARERAELERLIDAVHRGRGRALVLRGEPGIGKSALLDFAAARADSMLLLRATGVEGEAELAFGGLYGLLRPIFDRLDRIPGQQSTALAGALGLARAVDADRLLVSAGVFALVTEAAEDRPVLCLIDDAQWLDRSSADALMFVARRLQADPVGIVFAARDEGAQGFEAAGVAELLLMALDVASAAQILERSAPGLGGTVRARLLAEAAGNPLALAELPVGLSAEQLGGRAPLPFRIPLSSRLQRLFGGRITELPDATRMGLAIAAAEGAGELNTVLRAAGELGLPPDALDPAELAGLISADAPRLTFRHPLARAAAYEAAASSQRRTAHGALAAVLTGEEHADRRVWHQAMASAGPDEEVAAALESSARTAQHRAGHAAAATLFEHAADSTVERSRFLPRLSAAARAAWEAGQPDRAVELVSRALGAPDADAARSQLLRLRGVIEVARGNPRLALPTLVEAARLSEDPSVKLEILNEAAEAAGGSGDIGTLEDLVAEAQALPAPTPIDQFNQEELLAFGALMSGRYDEAHARLDTAVRLADEMAPDPRVLIRLTEIASAALGRGAGLQFAQRAVDEIRARGLISMLPVGLAELALELLWVSDFDGAFAAAREGYALSLDLGHGWGTGWHLAVMAQVDALHGRESDARERAANVLAAAETNGQTFLCTFARTTLGLLELTVGRPGHAADELFDLTTSPRPETHPVTALNAIPDAIEAIIRAGRPSEQAEIPLERFREWVRQAPTESRRALLARCEALLQPSDETFERAIKQADALPAFERARGELLYGEWLRRIRRRTDARPHLRTALKLFAALRTEPWAARTEAELRATGETARRRDPSTLDELTPQELQTARLAAEGLTNRDIAAQLFVSPRTVEYHLHKVFTKLGISSRTELIRDSSLKI